MAKAISRGSVAVALAWAASASAQSYTAIHGPYLCDVAPDGWPAANCCAASNPGSPFNTKYACAANNKATARQNILLIVSDDQAYCQYGFMSGRCTNQAGTAGTTCTADTDCEAGYTCRRPTPPATLPAFTGKPDPDDTSLLRLNDAACRNRQPPRGSVAACPGDEDVVTRADDSFHFDRTKFPCADTPKAARPPLNTLAIDKLATYGAVFPRAHVAGTMCKPSRRTMLNGRHQRHLQWLWPGSGRYECSRTGTAIPGQGCGNPVSTTCPTGRACATTRAIAEWLKKGYRAPSGNGVCSGGICQGNPNLSCATNDACYEGTYKAFGFGKLEVLAKTQGGFDVESYLGRKVGKFECRYAADVSGCTAKLANHEIPTDPVFEQTAGLKKVTDALRGTVKCYTAAGTEQTACDPNVGLRIYQEFPFFVWYGPNIPHKGAPWTDLDALSLYDADIMQRAQREHYGRVSWLDRGIGALTYHLMRSCSCDRSGVPRSLWDNTVVIFLTDQGFFMPEAKFSPTDTTHRTPLIISTPEHRAGTLTPKVFDDELASAVDLVPTILRYADMNYFATSTTGDVVRDEYTFARDLKEWIDAGGVPAPPGGYAHVTKERRLQFGEQGRSGVKGGANSESGGWPRYLITKPGLLGVCSASVSAGLDNHQHLQGCIDTSHCSAGTCRTKTMGGNWKRCVNRPDTACGDSANSGGAAGPCAAGLCVSLTCTSSASASHRYKDFEGKSCSDNTDCIPPDGVCEPIVLKVVSDSNSDPVRVYDLGYTPDENLNTSVEEDPNDLGVNEYLDIDLKTAFELCLDDFGHLNSTTREWEGKSAPGAGCPDPFRDFAHGNN